MLASLEPRDLRRHTSHSPIFSGTNNSFSSKYCRNGSGKKGRLQEEHRWSLMDVFHFSTFLSSATSSNFIAPVGQRKAQAWQPKHTSEGFWKGVVTSLLVPR